MSRKGQNYFRQSGLSLFHSLRKMPVVKVRLAGTGEEEWELIELQGELQSDMEVFDGLELGELHIDAKVCADATIGANNDCLCSISPGIPLRLPQDS